EKNGLPRREALPARVEQLEPSLSLEKFCESVRRIHDAIADGETYQVNFTYPLRGKFSGEAWGLFRRLRQAQSSKHQAYIEEEDQVVVCASPERFFKLQNGKIICRPMKGTAAAGQETVLQSSLKNRSENIMIVDMIRNDLGKIADCGSVKADPLFEVESYPSLVQMTSTVQATGSRSGVDWLCALFPCASITGAPKQKTMEWIHRLESEPRGVYTGCIGGFFGDGCTEFNVAIRTAVLSPATGELQYHSGCGIVWDSDPAEEYRESLLKAEVLTYSPEPFQLIETMRFDPGKGIVLWPYHRQRLLRSAAELGFELDTDELDQIISSLCFPKPGKVRMTLSESGKILLEASELPPTRPPMSFCIDSQATPSSHPELRHKTSRRTLYQAARARHPEVQETLLINENGELTEFSIGNLVWQAGGKLYTPPLHTGLLPGVARSAELDAGILTERICRREDLENAEKIWMINALRSWVEMERVC
ncbi:MAG: bifunctional chorismate-binding protein/class IV aminotransferase, partial [Kiritimatiellia bacterium]